MTCFSLFLLWPSLAYAGGPVAASPAELALASEQHLQLLLEDIGSLRRPGNSLPGNIIAYGEDAFIVASAGADGAQLGVIGAAEFGRGRVLAFSHTAFLGDWDLLDEGGSFLVNAILWASKTKPKSMQSPLVALLGAGEPLRERLGLRFPALELHANVHELTEILADGKVDVIVWAAGTPTALELEKLTGFVRSGGGVLLGVCPWGNQQVMERRGANESIRTHLAHNLFLRPMGLVFGGDTVSEQEYVLQPEQTGRLHAGRAYAAALKWLNSGKQGKTGKAGQFRPEQAANQVAGLLRALPPGEQEFTPPIEKALQAKAFAEFLPGPGRTSKRGEIVGYFGMLVATDKWANADPAEIEAAPGHEHFPGPVNPRAKRHEVSIEITPQQLKPGAWISTGYYAPAGELIRISSTTALEAEGWSLRIGAHKDKLWHKDELQRWPEVTGQWKLPQVKGRPFQVASPFGGLVYLVPSKDAQTTKFRIEGLVEAPFFDLNDAHSREDWKRRRLAPAPWAELACDGVILTVPSGAVRELADPTELMHYWNKVMQCYPQLRGEPQPDRPERLVEDIQISAGWMHSGYPVMTHGAEKTDHSHALDMQSLLTEGNWGYFHEFGHNAQRTDWTFSGTGEVTCNLFSLFVGEQMAEIEPWNNPWLVKQHAKPAMHFAAGAPFAKWKSEPGLALMMYATLQRDFGWGPFQAALAAYVNAPPEEQPKSDLDKHDRWMLRMSQATQRNLGPYFEHWGVPTSAQARAEIVHLKSWMPAEY